MKALSERFNRFLYFLVTLSSVPSDRPSREDDVQGQVKIKQDHFLNEILQGEIFQAFFWSAQVWTFYYNFCYLTGNSIPFDNYAKLIEQLI